MKSSDETLPAQAASNTRRQSAFPRILTFADAPDGDTSPFDGMELRDYLAAAALTGLIAKSETHNHASIEEGANCWLKKAIAVGFYQYADAMLEARSR